MAAGAAATGADLNTDPSSVMARARGGMPTVSVWRGSSSCRAPRDHRGELPRRRGAPRPGSSSASRRSQSSRRPRRDPRAAPRGSGVLLPRLRQVHSRQDRWLRLDGRVDGEDGSDRRSEPVGGARPGRLTATDRFEIVDTLGRDTIREISSRPTRRRQMTSPRISAHPLLRLGLRIDRGGSDRSHPPYRWHRRLWPRSLDQRELKVRTWSPWRAPTPPLSRVGTSSLHSPTRGRSPTGNGTG